MKPFHGADWVYEPDFERPAGIQILVTSQPKSLSVHQTLDPIDIEQNAQHRAELLSFIGELDGIQWLDQVHGDNVVALEQASLERPKADGVYTRHTQLGCAVLTADCVPIILYDDQGL